MSLDNTEAILLVFDQSNLTESPVAKKHTVCKNHLRLRFSFAFEVKYSVKWLFE